MSVGILYSLSGCIECTLIVDSMCSMRVICSPTVPCLSDISTISLRVVSMMVWVGPIYGSWRYLSIYIWLCWYIGLSVGTLGCGC